MMLQTTVNIVSNKRVKGNYWHCVLRSPAIACKAKPGEFISVKLSHGHKPFLRRPFSIHNICSGNIEILYESLGEGTKMLSVKRSGESLDVIGPLGHGFDYRENLPVRQAGGKTYLSGRQAENRQTILVAGGMGIAPLLFLASKIKSNEKTILIGARSKSQILCEKEFKNSGCSVKIATDDGSVGFKGRVTDLLNNILQANRPTGQQATIYACGPKPMLREICNISLKYNMPAQISLEEHMSCGFGACLGCVVNTRGGYKRVCKEGPVFSARELVW